MLIYFKKEFISVKAKLIFLASLLQVTWSFWNHSNMLILVLEKHFLLLIIQNVWLVMYTYLYSGPK